MRLIANPVCQFRDLWMRQGFALARVSLTGTIRFDQLWLVFSWINEGLDIIFHHNTKRVRKEKPRTRRRGVWPFWYSLSTENICASRRKRLPHCPSASRLNAVNIVEKGSVSPCGIFLPLSILSLCTLYIHIYILWWAASRSMKRLWSKRGRFAAERSNAHTRRGTPENRYGHLDHRLEWTNARLTLSLGSSSWAFAGLLPCRSPFTIFGWLK